MDDRDMSKNGIFDGFKKIIFGKVKFLILAIVILLIIVFCVFFLNKGNRIKIKVKSSLEKLVEKSNLETVSITYNVIAKKCKNEDKCNKNSNNISDFEYVASCTGSATAGIDFKKVLIDVDTDNKKIIITIPDASITSEPNVQPPKILNGIDLAAGKTADAIKLCKEVTKEKSESDDNINSIAKEQAKIVLEQYYKQWVSVYDSSYTVEIK